MSIESSVPQESLLSSPNAPLEIPPKISPKTPRKTPEKIQQTPVRSLAKTPPSSEPPHPPTVAKHKARSKSRHRKFTRPASPRRSRSQPYKIRTSQASIAGQEMIATALHETNEAEIVALASRYFYKKQGQPVVETLALGCSIASLHRFRRGCRVRRFEEYCQALELDPRVISGEASLPALLPELCGAGGDRVTTAKHTVCLGRETELCQIEAILRSGGIRLYLQGAQGVGKTVLADEIAHTLASKLGIARRITIAIKPYESLGSRQIPRWRVQRSIDRLERELTYACSPTLSDDAIQLPRDVLFTRLAEKSTLLVIDDLDCADDLEAVLGLIYGLPPSVQIVMTGSAKLAIERVIRIEPLAAAAIAELIDHCCEDRQLTISANDCHWLQVTSQGFPAPVIKAVALLAESGRFARQSITRLRDDCLISYIRLGLDRLDDNARTVAAVLSLFPQPPTLDTIAEIAALDSIDRAGFGAIVSHLDQLNLVCYDTTHQTCGAPRRERACFAQELDAHPERYAIYHRWIDRYCRIAARFPSDDWKVWQDYTPIDREWDNWLKALEWCVAQHHYDRACELWAGLRGYTNLRGYWPERLRWLEWAIAVAEVRQDHLAQARFWRDRAWTLALTGDREQRQQAELCFQKALQLAQHAREVVRFQAETAIDNFEQVWQEFQSELALEHAVLCLENGDFEGAQTWITRERTHLNDLLTLTSWTAFPARWQRQSLRADYYEAEVFFYRQDYASARNAYCNVLNRARDLGWDQLCAYATNWLADIALCEHSYETAETWLIQTQHYLEGRQDSRSLGFYHQSLARTYAGRDRHSAADESARRAANAFTQVGLFDRARTVVEEFQLA